MHLFQSKDALVENARNSRTKNFIFCAGKARGNAKAWAGCHWDQIVHLSQNETDVMDIRLVGKTNQLNQLEHNHRMISSDCCLILCGDAPSSRSLTLAMAVVRKCSQVVSISLGKNNIRKPHRPKVLSVCAVTSFTGECRQNGKLRE
jgi:hypothetical protein